MNELLIEFAAIIEVHTIELETGPGSKVIERCVFIFKDSSRLVTYESRKGSKFKYGYQWMNTENQTIYRWDNTPHFPDFDTFPYHRHLGPDELPEPFPQVSLTDVLNFIASQLL
ncbi:toxin-antitoxin system TumE family protein [Spirosoma validum]|uniref:Uncharacterized protein n=1 Tax=Spirosoma validum TaxID=2771355 RepID=A0A927B173_9BACT|nr:DUF6516 family protein [Spirosoma validum]MBD2753680.1 hypothetical protein [Spirosoma validum]